MCWQGKKLSLDYLQLSSSIRRGSNNWISFYSVHSSKQTCKQELTRNWRDVLHIPAVVHHLDRG